MSLHLVRVLEFELPAVPRPHYNALEVPVGEELEQELPQLHGPGVGEEAGSVAGQGVGVVRVVVVRYTVVVVTGVLGVASTTAHTLPLAGPGAGAGLPGVQHREHGEGAEVTQSALTF